jgi:UDP-N-acetylglucosamine 2-epimerase (non-hydrolysing)
MTSPLKIMSTVGARPNFMKIAPFIRAIERHHAANPAGRRIEHILVHTGQHYDAAMSHSFFLTLGIPPPDVNLEIGSGSHAEQVGRTMIAFEKSMLQHRPDWVVVVGDVNATCACSITARKLLVRVAHIEAGLRSFDMTMPEEINRLVTDRLSNLLLTPDPFADANLRREGADPATIVQVGNIMIDTLDANRPAAAALDPADFLARQAFPGRSPESIAAFCKSMRNGFAAITLHRPSNVDTPESLGGLARFFLDSASHALPLVWSVHPRTRARLQDFSLWPEILACERLLLVQPLDYLEMLNLNLHATIFLTDSGGLQEECCVLGTPCLTLRENTERPVTLEEHGGVSRLVGNSLLRVRQGFDDLRSRPRRPHRPPLWDGRTADRIVAALLSASA